MKHNILYIAALAFAVFISALAQLFLKKAADRPHETGIQEFINVWVLGGYFLFFCSSFIAMLVLRVLPLSYIAVSESLGYVFVLLLSRILLKEHIGSRKKIGVCVIMLGILLFYAF